MSIEQMRSAISDAYPGKAWPIKVKYMPESQVLAVYKRIMNPKKK